MKRIYLKTPSLTTTEYVAKYMYLAQQELTTYRPTEIKYDSMISYRDICSAHKPNFEA